MKAREAAVHAAVERAVRPRSLFEASPGAFAAIEGFSATPRRVGGEERTEVVAREAGLEFLVDPLGGQKTGLFLDQRENRRRVGTLASGARVLDVYTYVGGFALAAARGGAATVTAVDISPRALDRARANAARAGRPVEFVEADAFRYLETAAPRGFDLVILDPPKFARERKDLEAALRGYRRLNALALAACADGAILASATCSQLVGRSDFERILAGAALDARRRLQILEVSGAGPDHPLPPAFAEGSYLKFALCRVS
jgi:23S rRNA (cytosine1962-C5)-methyltransferase